MFYYKPVSSNPPAPPVDPEKTLYREQSKYTDPEANQEEQDEREQEKQAEEEEEEQEENSGRNKNDNLLWKCNCITFFNHMFYFTPVA